MQRVESTEPEPSGFRSEPDKTGRVAAVIATVVLVGGIIALGIVVVAVRDRVAVKIESVVESVDSTDDGCEWQLSIELLNNTDELLMVERMAAILNRSTRSGDLEPAPRLAPGDVGTHLVTFRLPPERPCPGVDEINHGNLIFHLSDGSSESVRF